MIARAAGGLRHYLVLYARVVAWVRRVRTASGATAVQIAESVGGRRRILAHLGSAHTEAELGLLVERARGLLGDADQGQLDLGVEPTSLKARLVTPQTDTGLFAGLFAEAGRPAGRARGAFSPCRITSSKKRVVPVSNVAVST